MLKKTFYRFDVGFFKRETNVYFTNSYYRYVTLKHRVCKFEYQTGFTCSVTLFAFLYFFVFVSYGLSLLPQPFIFSEATPLLLFI